MKRKILVAALVLLFAFSAVCGTMAYFTTQGTATNVITSGSIAAEIREYADREMTKPFENLTGVMPGAAAIKVVTVENTGANEAWVRLSVTKDYELAEERAAVRGADAIARQEIKTLVHLDINSEYWTEQDGWYYYSEPLQPGETSQPLFTSITLDEALGNVWQGATFIIQVDMQAVQVANNGATALEAAGWPASGES